MGTTEVLEYVRSTYLLSYKVEVSAIKGSAKGANVYRLIQQALILAERLEGLWRAALEGLYHGKVDDIAAQGEWFENQTRRSVELFRDLIRLAKKRLPPSEQREAAIADCKKSLAHLLSLSSRVATEWPKLDPAMIQESVAEFKRGETVSLEGFLREIQGGDVGGGRAAPLLFRR